MKRLLLALILMLSFQTLTKADGIGEFEIDGFILKESLLDHFKRKEIEIKKQDGFIYPNKDFYSVTFAKSKFKQYDRIQFHLKAEDKKYIIYSISGQKIYDNDIKKCYQKMDSILLEIKKIFYNPKVLDLGISNHRIDKSGKSKVKAMIIDLRAEKFVEKAIPIECYDWSFENEKKGRKDLLSISVDSKEFDYWINNKAYN